MKSTFREGYQLVVRGAHDYQELATYNLTPLNIYIGLSTLFLLAGGLVFLLIVFTPLKEYVPGYGDVIERREMAELEENVAELMDLVEGQNLYIENLKRTVLGEAVTADSIEAQSAAGGIAGDVAPLPPSAEELRLREELERQRAGQREASVAAAPPPTSGSNAVSLAQVYLVAPVHGEVSAGFNLATDHTGVDILAPQNTAIKATRAGIVFLSEFSNANGNVIGIQHDNNLISFYKHNSSLLKQVGDRVQAGEAIAIIGNTGTQSTGPHLHFELWHEGRAVDPTAFVSF
ncbi:M23 family metallopeptidase [Neolewinella litorea]|uniref:M23 family metallopeptidase n=1 Tax=Neolewinella litorea TaxID=2562452 RepID=A0A4S4NE46_9BACT|nr:M23 family metallopeptidase [Neolewinella litorea]THH36358.1 M23 family metallopeptidase [Neolewinella litorea]